MRGDYLILCKSSSIDSTSNSLSIFEIIDDVTIRVSEDKQLADIPIGIQAIIHFTREEDEEGTLKKKFEIQVENPEGETTKIDKELEVKFKEEHRRFRVRVNFGISFKHTGKYIFRVIDKEEKVYCMNELVVNSIKNDK